MIDASAVSPSCRRRPVGHDLSSSQARKSWIPAFEVVIQSAFRCWTGADPLFGTRIVGRDSPHLSMVQGSCGAGRAPYCSDVPQMAWPWLTLPPPGRWPVRSAGIRVECVRASRRGVPWPLAHSPAFARKPRFFISRRAHARSPCGACTAPAWPPRSPSGSASPAPGPVRSGVSTRLFNVSAVTSCRSVGGGL